MNRKTKLAVYLKACIPVLCVISFTLVLPIAAKYLGSAVCYSVSGSKTARETVEQTLSKMHAPALYDTVSSVPLEDRYLIKERDGEILVFDGKMTPLYRIDSRIENLSENDRESVRDGITVRDKSTLCEMVAHMES